MERLILLLILTGGAIQDLISKKVSNRWILVGLICYPIIEGFYFIRGPSLTWQIFLESLICFYLRFLLFLVIFFFLFFFRMVGAGDIKLVALIGAYLGLREGFSVVFLGLAAAAVWSFLILVYRQILIQRLLYFVTYFKQFVKTGEKRPYFVKERDYPGAVICLAPFFWMGYLFVFLV